MQRITPIILLLLSACLPKQAAPLVLEGTAIQAQLSVQNNHGDWETASSELNERYQKALEAFGAADGTQKASIQLALRAEFFSQLQGQHRWTVTGTISLLLDSSTDSEPTTKSVDLAVFLDYPHQGEDEALEAALPLLKRQVQDLLQSAAATPTL